MPAYTYALGYHGCDVSVADALFAGEAMRRSENDYDWLGHGYYFWEDDPKRALQWAQELSKNPKSSTSEAAVIGAVIRLGKCLNLAETDSLLEVRATYDAWNSLYADFGMSMPQNKGKNLKLRYLDCFIFEWLHQFREDSDLPPYDSVRGFFSEGEMLYPGSEIHQQDHIQICVRNLDCVMGFFRPRFDF